MNSLHLIPLDFEFHSSNNPKLHVICSSFDSKDFWLHTVEQKAKLVQYINSLDKKKVILLAYYAIAEARSFLALGLNPMEFQWIDLYAEFKMQQNSNNKYIYGLFVDENGNIAQSFPIKPKELGEVEEEEDDESHSKVPSNLINSVYKNLGIVLSSKQKDKMRKIILSKDEAAIEQHKDEIMEYCASDTKYLIPLYEAICKSFTDQGLSNFHADMLSRGRYAAATAICESQGILINTELLDKIILKTPEIINEARTTVNKHFPAFASEYTPFKFLKDGEIKVLKTVKAKKNTKAIQTYITSLNIKEWPKTKTGGFSTKKDYLEEYRFVPGIEALYQCNKTESSLKWFNKNNGDGFFSALGYDNRVRPFFGVFGTQTGRNAPKAKTFPFAMSSYLRAIIQPPKKGFLIGADFSQQEVAVAAWLSQDKNMINAYLSGDVYLTFAKMAGLVPPDGTKKQYKAMRDLCKSTVLGIQYGMGPAKLQYKLSFDTKRQVSMEETMLMYNSHKTVFATYWLWVKDITKQYQRRIPLITPDGFVLWQDNPRITSVRNFPVQGTSASITRRAVVLAVERKVSVICQLHDALYAETFQLRQDIKILKECMRQATEEILGKGCIEIRIDIKLAYGKYRNLVEDKGKDEWEAIQKLLVD